MDGLFPALAVLGGAAAFALFWSGIAWTIGQAGGWGALARRFRTDAPPDPNAWASHVTSGSVGSARYNGVLRVWVQPDGLRLAVWAPFRPGHPPVLVPWNEITAVERKRFLGLSRFEVTVGEPRVATLTLPEAVVEAMRDALPHATAPADEPAP